MAVYLSQKQYESYQQGSTLPIIGGNHSALCDLPIFVNIHPHSIGDLAADVVIVSVHSIGGKLFQLCHYIISLE